MQAQMIKLEGVDHPSAVMNRNQEAARANANSQLSSDVEAFIHLYRIDEKASKALLQEHPAVQQIVLDGGSLKSARNKGASVMGRIMKAKQVLARISQASVETGAVEQFIARHEIDEKAAQELRGENPVVQQAVLDSGPLTGVHNPSAVVITRIRKAKQGKLATCQMSASLSKGEASIVRGAVDEFIAQNGIDEKAAQELLGECLAIQQAVLLCGPLTSCKNPSAVLIGRIRSAKQGKLSTRQMFPPATPGIFECSGTYVNDGASVSPSAQLLCYDKEDPEQQSTAASSQDNDDVLSTSSEPSLDLGSEAAISIFAKEGRSEIKRPAKSEKDVFHEVLISAAYVRGRKYIRASQSIKCLQQDACHPGACLQTIFQADDINAVHENFRSSC